MMDRKAIARQTLEILKQGKYTYQDTAVTIREAHLYSVEHSRLFTPKQGEQLLHEYAGKHTGDRGTSTCETAAGHSDACRQEVKNISTVDAVLELSAEGAAHTGVLNFASAKNPGGGFLNGAMAQEESLAASGGLYKTLTVHEEYYRANRGTSSMIYTDHAIYSPEVVFFRDGSFRLLETLVTASVLTLPAVNMGQVILKGEDIGMARIAMRRRMELALALFADNGAKNLVLGAYGCGVFRNDPVQVAAWWKELLESGYGTYFDHIVYAVLDHSARQECILAFEEAFPYPA